MYKQILLATDGSACAQRATESAARLTKQSDAKLTVISVFPDLMPALGVIDMDLTEQYIESQEQSINSAFTDVICKARLILGHHGVEFDFVQARGNASEEIVACAHKLHADLIIVGHRGLSSLQSLILGSTSERIVHVASCCVLVVK